MKAIKNILLLSVLTLAVTSCSAPKYATISSTPDLSEYKYVYIAETGEKTSVTGGTFGGQYGIWGLTESKSFNPTDVIAGKFMKQGFIKVPYITDEHKDKTIVVNYGESDRKKSFWSLTIEITIQLLDPSTYNLICVASAQGKGETETDCIRKATNKCLEAIFKAPLSE